METLFTALCKCSLSSSVLDRNRLHKMREWRNLCRFSFLMETRRRIVLVDWNVPGLDLSLIIVKLAPRLSLSPEETRGIRDQSESIDGGQSGLLLPWVWKSYWSKMECCLVSCLFCLMDWIETNWSSGGISFLLITGDNTVAHQSGLGWNDNSEMTSYFRLSELPPGTWVQLKRLDVNVYWIYVY